MAERAEVETMLYQALGEPIGLLLRTNDPTKARQFIYQTRSKIADPDLGCLQLRVVDLGDGPMIAIVKGAVMPVVEYQAPAPATLDGTSPNLNLKDL